jgi:hypothetical protein
MRQPWDPSPHKSQNLNSLGPAPQGLPHFRSCAESGSGEASDNVRQGREVKSQSWFSQLPFLSKGTKARASHYAGSGKRGLEGALPTVQALGSLHMINDSDQAGSRIIGWLMSSLCSLPKMFSQPIVKAWEIPYF